jgi:hypothetical protein
VVQKEKLAYTVLLGLKVLRAYKGQLVLKGILGLRDQLVPRVIPEILGLRDLQVRPLPCMIRAIRSWGLWQALAVSSFSQTIKENRLSESQF